MTRVPAGGTPAPTATAVAVAVVAALRRAGVADVVLAPGSRSAALAVVLHQADRAGGPRLHVRVDERSAGFLALGLAKGAHRPVGIVTTSGTAVANLHPAVLEAVHSGVPLLVLSADRPAALRGTGANQTTEQVGLFGPRVPCADVEPGDADAAVAAIAAAAGRRGPAHVNLQFAEPLLPATLPVELPATRADEIAARPPRHVRAAAGPRLDRGPRTVVVAGDDAGPPARLLAQDANWPLLAEPTSGSRTGTHALRTHRLLAAGALGEQVERVVVAGHPTLSRPITRLISRPDVEVLAVPGVTGQWTDPGRVATRLPDIPVVEGRDPDDWIEAWRAADRVVSGAVDVRAAEPDGLPLRVAATVAAAVGPGSLLVVGSSQPIRDLDLMATPYPAGQRRLILGNRGLAGIDGTLATAIGAALGRPSSSSALAYVGDVTFAHDVGALLIGPDEPRPALDIVVANDDGGAIFATLEQGAQAYAEAFERVFGTPHGLRVEDVCAATGTAYARAGDERELAALIAAPPTGIRVIEVPLDRRSRRALDLEVSGLAQTAIAIKPGS